MRHLNNITDTETLEVHGKYDGSKSNHIHRRKKTLEETPRTVLRPNESGSYRRRQKSTPQLTSCAHPQRREAAIPPPHPTNRTSVTISTAHTAKAQNERTVAHKQTTRATTRDRSSAVALRSEAKRHDLTDRAVGASTALWYSRSATTGSTSIPLGLRRS